MLIDAIYAGLISGAADSPLVIPAFNRDGDCLSDLVHADVRLDRRRRVRAARFDDDYGVEVAMAEAPHGTAPSLKGKDLANPMAMLLACGAVLHYAADQGPPGRRARLAGDLRGRAGGDRHRHQDRRPRRARDHPEFTDAVVDKVRTKVEIWSALGTR